MSGDRGGSGCGRRGCRGRRVGELASRPAHRSASPRRTRPPAASSSCRPRRSPRRTGPGWAGGGLYDRRVGGRIGRDRSRFPPWNTAAVPAGRDTLVAIADATDGTTAASPAATVETDNAVAPPTPSTPAPIRSPRGPRSPCAARVRLLAAHVPAWNLRARTIPRSGRTSISWATARAAPSSARRPVRTTAPCCGSPAWTPPSATWRSTATARPRPAGPGGSSRCAASPTTCCCSGCPSGRLRTVGVYAWGTIRDVSVQDSVIHRTAGTADTGVEYAQGAADAVGSRRQRRAAHDDHAVQGLRHQLLPVARRQGLPLGRGRWRWGIRSPAHPDPAVADGTSEGGIWAGGQDAVIRDNTIARTGWEWIDTFGQRAACADRGQPTQLYPVRPRGGTRDVRQPNPGQHDLARAPRHRHRVVVRRSGLAATDDPAELVTGAEAGINVDVGADGNTIESNVITDTATYGIRLQGDLPQRGARQRPPPVGPAGSCGRDRRTDRHGCLGAAGREQRHRQRLPRRRRCPPDRRLVRRIRPPTQPQTEACGEAVQGLRAACAAGTPVQGSSCPAHRVVELFVPTQPTIRSASVPAVISMYARPRIVRGRPTSRTRLSVRSASVSLYGSSPRRNSSSPSSRPRRMPGGCSPGRPGCRANSGGTPGRMPSGSRTRASPTSMESWNAIADVVEL